MDKPVFNSNRMPVLMAAKTAALCARTNALTAHCVEDMRVKAEELLGRDDPLRPACILFATKFEELQRDAYALRMLGEALDREIDLALGIGTVAPRYRRDIDG